MICLSPRKSVGRSQHLPNQPSYGKPRLRGDALNVAGARAFQRTIGEGLKLPNEQPKKWRLWLNDGSCLRLRPKYPNHVWSHDFVEDRTHDGRKYRMLNIIGELTRECPANRMNRKLNSIDTIDVLSDLFILRGVPARIRSDNGREFAAKAVREWITTVGASTAYIEPGSPRENGDIESFNARPRDELLNGEIFHTIEEAKVVIEAWRRHYNAASYCPSLYKSLIQIGLAADLVVLGGDRRLRTRSTRRFAASAWSVDRLNNQGGALHRE
jgi:transposase InsO family protein